MTGKYWSEGPLGQINPVSGCTKISEACRSCYAEAAHTMHYADGHGKGFFNKPFSEVTLRPEQLKKFDRLARTKKPHVVFVSNMADLFHEKVPFEYIDEVFSRMANQKRHTYLVLTKRAARMKEFVEWHMNKWDATPDDFVHVFSNVWLGVTAESQARADECIPHLLETPAAHRWISAEPLLRPLFLSSTWIDNARYGDHAGMNGGIDLIIAGFESGRKARLANAAWAYDLKHQCEAANVKFYWKQWGDGAIMGDNRQNLNDLDDITHPDSNQVLDGIDYSLLKPAGIWRVS